MQRYIEGLENIAPFEVVKGVYIEKECFFELGLYTESGKIKRRTFKAKYYGELEKVYERSIK